jgi:hypothetical protein
VRTTSFSGDGGGEAIAANMSFFGPNMDDWEKM